MADFDAVLLARIQFAFTVAFHIVFPAMSIGLASYLAVLEGMWLRTGKQLYMDLFQYWVKIFSLSFAMGVVSGLVMSYEFGTNWARFSDLTGPVIGPLMGYEVLTAFFLEAGFLGIMLFGMKRVGPRLHFAATCIVAFGTLISAFWILAVNSWMQTPQGHIMGADGRFLPGDWWAIIFTPSLSYRLPHMVLATYLSVAFLVGGVAAWHLLRDSGNAATRTMFSMAMWMAVAVAPLQIVIGDLHGLNTLEHQPAKVAAMEGHYETRRGAPLVLFGLPDDAGEVMRHALEIPRLGSLILTHSWDGEVRGLKSWPKEERPPVPIVFWSFRIMVGLGVAMAGLGVAGLVLRWRGRLYHTRWLLRGMVVMTLSGFVALLAGWMVTEVGRQPYTVYGLLRTADSVSPIAASAVAASLAAFVVVYFLVFGSGVTYMARLLARPPHYGETGPSPDVPTRTASLVGAVEPAGEAS